MDDGVSGTSSARITYSQQFEEMFPYYLSIGISADQYWEQDSTLVRAYRKADELRQERQNFNAWLQGAYFYDALCAVSPVLHAFAKRGAKPIEYHKAPYELKPKQKEYTEEEINRKVDQSRDFFEGMMAVFNKKFDKKGGNDHAADTDTGKRADIQSQREPEKASGNAGEDSGHTDPES